MTRIQFCLQCFPNATVARINEVIHFDDWHLCESLENLMIFNDSYSHVSHIHLANTKLSCSKGVFAHAHVCAWLCVCVCACEQCGFLGCCLSYCDSISLCLSVNSAGLSLFLCLNEQLNTWPQRRKPSVSHIKGLLEVFSVAASMLNIARVWLTSGDQLPTLHNAFKNTGANNTWCHRDKTSAGKN